MAKIPVAYRLSWESLKTLDFISVSLGKSKSWVLENALFSFSKEVQKFLTSNADLKDYLTIKGELWKDSLLSEMLRYHLSKGFLLKNGIKKIIAMIESGVNKEHIERVCVIYEKLSNDTEYQEIIREIKIGLMNMETLDLERIHQKLELRNKTGITK